MEREPAGTLISLLDEDGNENEFEHLATLVYDGHRYVALTPAYQKPDEFVNNDGLLIILKISADDDGNDVLLSISEDEYREVSKKFETELENDFDFEDD